jgi:maltose O-acetyltransferase
MIRDFLFNYIFLKIRIFLYKNRSNNKPQGHKPQLIQPLLCLGKGKIVFQENVILGFPTSSGYHNSYIHLSATTKHSEINIGKDTIINNNSTLIADKAKIIIGKNCLIGTSFTAFTSDFHNLNPKNRMSQDYPSGDIILGDNIFIGSNVTILKGVTVGKDSVIGACSVVTKDIPEGVVAVGNPCKVVRRFYSKSS